MAWGTWSRKQAADGAAVAGLDLNAGRARAAFAAPGMPARPVLLGDTDEELPLAVGLEHRAPEVGPAVLRLRRRAPHQLCEGFLPALGQPRLWTSGRHKLDAAGAFAAVAEKIRSALAGTAGAAVTFPPYLAPGQVKVATGILEAAKISILGTAALPLAIAAATPDFTRGTAVVVDVDDHAATASALVADHKHYRVLASLSVPAGLRAWVDQLMAFVADRCIRVCRRDPRDSAAAEASLDEQLTATLAAPRSIKPLALSVRTEHWFQNLVLAPDELERACVPLARTLADGLRQVLADVPAPEVAWLTSSASRLPGLTGAVGLRLPERTVVDELPPAAPAEAAHRLALRRLRGELPAGHLDAALPRTPTAGPGGERLTVR
jgi:hypothetical protein